MQALLLVSVLLVSALCDTYTIDCTSTAAHAGVLTTGCLSTYQSETGTLPEDALDYWYTYCGQPGGFIDTQNGFPAEGDVISLIGDCNVYRTYFYLTESFDGNFTIQGDNGDRSDTLIVFNGGFDLVEMDDYSAETNIPLNARITFKDLTFTSEANSGTNNFRLVEQGYGHSVFQNLELNDAYFTRFGGILTSHYGAESSNYGSGGYPNNQYSVTVDGLEVTWSSGAANAPNSGFYFTSNAFVAVGEGVSVDISNVNVHDVYINSPLVWANDPYGIDRDSKYTRDITISDVTFTDIGSYTSEGSLILYGAESLSPSSPIFAYDFTVDISNVQVTGHTDVSGGNNQDYVAYVNWKPAYYSGSGYGFDGTFAFHDSIINGSQFDSWTAGIYVFGRGATSFSGNTIVGNSIAHPSDNAGFATGTTFFYIDGVDAAVFENNGVSDNTNFVSGLVYTSEESSNTFFDSNTFSNNVGSADNYFLSQGGAVHLAGSASFSGNTFDSNQAEIGGAVFVDNVDAKFTGDSFVSNVAAVSRNRAGVVGTGGAIFKNHGGVLAIEDGTFTSNQATYGGGALSVLHDYRVQSASTVQSTDGGDLTISTSSFDGNNAEHGGAIYFFSRNSIISDSNFTNNNATAGGAVSSLDINPFVSSPLLFRNTIFDNNVAHGGVIAGVDLRDGGAVSTHRSATFTKSQFLNNVAENGKGGAITAWKGLRTEYSQFSANSASDNGGAIWSTPTQPEALVLFRSDFSDNTAGQDGGAVWSDNPLATFDGASFTSNIATGNGGGAYLATEAHVKGSGFVSNQATSGGALYTVGDSEIDLTRFDSNVASQDGGAIACISSPVGQVDFTLETSGNFFFNNAATGIGAHLSTSCTFVDIGSTFQSAQVTAGQASVQCDGDSRVLRQCELSFTNSRFIGDSLTILAPVTATLQPFSSGLVIVKSTFTTFTGIIEAESTEIKDSTFSDYDLTINSPTTVSGSKFVTGTNEDETGPFSYTDSSFQFATINEHDVSSFDHVTFDQSSHLTTFVATSLVDVEIQGNSDVTFKDTANIRRTTADDSSTVTSEGATTVSHVTVGAYTQSTGSLTINNDFSAGGSGLAVNIAIDIDGNGDFNFVDGTLTWSDGAITGAGAFNLLAGTAKLESGKLLSRETESDAELEITGSPAFSLDAHFNARGGQSFSDDATITSGGADGAFFTWGETSFGLNNNLGVDSHNYGDFFFSISDRTTYSSVTFGGAWATEHNHTLTATDQRSFFVYETYDSGNGQGNGSIVYTDVGNQYAIIELSATFDQRRFECHNPFETVIYIYNETYTYPDLSVGDYPVAYVSCRNQTSSDPQSTLWLYSGASSATPMVGLFIALVLALLF